MGDPVLDDFFFFLIKRQKKKIGLLLQLTKKLKSLLSGHCGFPRVFVFVWDQTCLLSGLCLSNFITVADEGHTWSVQREIVCAHQDNIFDPVKLAQFPADGCQDYFAFLTQSLWKSTKAPTSNKPHTPRNHTSLIEAN